MRRLSIHVNKPASYALNWLQQYRPDYALLLFVNMGDYSADIVRRIISQGTRIIARWYPLQGLSSVDAFVSTCTQLAARYGIKDFVAQNEPIIHTRSEMECLNAWQTAWANKLQACGLHAWVGNFSVGNPPHLEHMPLFAPAIRAAVASGGGLAYHGYGWPDLWNNYEWWAGRAPRLLYHAGVDAPVVLTEAGLDGLLAGGRRGWRSACNAHEYIAMLKEWDEILPPNVMGICHYNYGCYSDWRDYELTAEAARLLGEYIVQRGKGDGMWIVRRDKDATLRLWRRDVTSHVEVRRFDSYLPHVVGAEMGRFWPVEALKAQAIAARSFAAYWIAHGGKHADRRADLCSEPCCQTYRRGTDYPRTIFATQATDGMVVYKFGRIYQTQYVSRCGQPHCPLCKGYGGHNGRIWWGRLCQEGAKYMAEHGATARQILEKYYGSNIELRAPAQQGGTMTQLEERLLSYLDKFWTLKPRYNPATALSRAAREARLGLPISEEGRATEWGLRYALQFHAHGMVYCREGDWGHVKVVRY